MDLIATLRDKIDGLVDGDYKPGLRAVLLHVQTAFRHLSRGQNDNDDTAFTDAIYRTNQAFEGSVKEAYRVLAGKDPSRKTSFEIEAYLDKNNVFRSRVMKQFTNYRTDWRNPSTHDYKLDFDSSEALLAIVSVTAFSILLIDSISEHQSFLKAKEETEPNREEIIRRISVPGQELTESITRTILEFATSHQPVSGSPRETELQVIGALRGFMSTALPNVQVESEAKLDEERPFRVDLLVSSPDEKVIVEIKTRLTSTNYDIAVSRMEQYMTHTGIKNAILLFLPDRPGELTSEDLRIESIDGQLTVLKPSGKD